jgi:hypothetical protein
LTLRVLHLISNHKFTGPVDPALELARALLAAGAETRVAVGRAPSGNGVLDDILRRKGLEPFPGLELPKHRRLLANRRDAARLVEHLRREPVDVLHAHLDTAHGTAARVVHLLGRTTAGAAGRGTPLVVRSLYDDRAPRPTLRHRRLYGRQCDGIFLFGRRVR